MNYLQNVPVLKHKSYRCVSWLHIYIYISFFFHLHTDSWRRHTYKTKINKCTINKASKQLINRTTIFYHNIPFYITYKKMFIFYITKLIPSQFNFIDILYFLHCFHMELKKNFWVESLPHNLLIQRNEYCQTSILFRKTILFQ